MNIELSEQEKLRRQSLAALRELGIDPYPAARYEVTATARKIAENFDPAKTTTSMYGSPDASCPGASWAAPPSSSCRTIRAASRSISAATTSARRGSHAVQHGVQETARYRRHRRSRRLRLHHQHGRAVGTLPEVYAHLQVAAAAAVVKEKDGQTFDAFTDPEIRYPPTLRRPDSSPPRAGGLRQPGQDHQHDA